MKIKFLFLTLIMFCQSFGLLATQKKTSITFKSDVDFTIRIAKPIDGALNASVFNYKIDVKSNDSTKLEFDISDFGSLRCEYSFGSYLYFFMEEGDNIIMENKNSRLIFKGDNAEGYQYMLDNYSSKGTATYYPMIESIFKRYITKDVDVKSIDKVFRDSLLVNCNNDIQKLKEKGKISDRYASLMRQNLFGLYSSIMYYHYRDVYRGRRIERDRPPINNYKPTAKDSVEIMRKIDEIYLDNLKHDNPLKFVYQFPFHDYYKFKYKMCNENEKSKLMGDNDNESFGATNVHFLLAPDSLQQILLGENLVYQLKNMYNYNNHEKMFRFISNKFPKSEYLPIIQGLMIDKEKTFRKKYDSLSVSYLDRNTVHSLKELSQLTSLKGKIIYIDMWTSFCVPCKKQFQYNDDLHKVLAKYNNLEKVYISLDSDEDDMKWKDNIVCYHLSGFHIRASKALIEDLKNHIFGGQPCTIPRYILIDEMGRILDKNLPRPEAIDVLKYELEKLIGAR